MGSLLGVSDQVVHKRGPAKRFLRLGYLRGGSLGLLLPGAWAGLPDGFWPGGKLLLDGAMRSSSWSIRKRFAFVTFGCSGFMMHDSKLVGTVSDHPAGSCTSCAKLSPT